MFECLLCNCSGMQLQVSVLPAQYRYNVYALNNIGGRPGEEKRVVIVARSQRDNSTIEHTVHWCGLLETLLPSRLAIKFAASEWTHDLFVGGVCRIGWSMAYRRVSWWWCAHASSQQADPGWSTGGGSSWFRLAAPTWAPPRRPRRCHPGSASRPDKSGEPGDNNNNAHQV